MRKIITIRPEESFVSSIKDGIIQYYQPESKILLEKIVSYKFEPVVFNYDHIPDVARFGPSRAYSKRYSIWKEKTELEKPMALDNGLLRDRQLVNNYEPGYFG